MPQSTISQHLSKLKAAKMVTGTRKGLEIYYEVTDNRTKINISMFSLNADFYFKIRNAILFYDFTERIAFLF